MTKDPNNLGLSKWVMPKEISFNKLMNLDFNELDLSELDLGVFESGSILQCERR